MLLDVRLSYTFNPLMLPFEPENLEALRARLPAALKARYDVEAVARKVGRRPGELREHVFDFDDGIRCIVSIDFYRNDPPLLHLSVGVQEGTKLNFGEFLVRAENLASQLWPDTLLLLRERVLTKQAIHVSYDVPKAFL